MEKFHIYPLMEKTQILSNIEKCQSLTTSSLTCTKSLQKTCFCDYLGIPPFSKKTCPLKTRYVHMYNSFEKKNIAWRHLRQSKKYTSPHVWDLDFFPFPSFSCLRFSPNGKNFQSPKTGTCKKITLPFWVFSEYSLKKRENKDIDNYIRLQKKPYIAKHT